MLKRIFIVLMFSSFIAACSKEEPPPPATPQTTIPPATTPAPEASPPSTSGSATAPVPPTPAPQSTAPTPPASSSGAATAGAANGEQIYKQTCAVCHVAGVAGAPKLEDKANWAPRITQGKETLYTHAIKGFQGKAGMMPPKGGNMSLSDEQVKAAVDYMVTQAGK